MREHPTLITALLATHALNTITHTSLLPIRAAPAAHLAEVEMSGKRKKKKQGGTTKKHRLRTSAVDRGRAPKSFQRILEDVSLRIIYLLRSKRWGPQGFAVLHTPAPFPASRGF